MIFQGSNLSPSSVCVLVLDFDDIKDHLKCSDKEAYQILGTAKRGKFSDCIMEDFWLTIEAMRHTVKDSTPETRKYYEELGKKDDTPEELKKC